MRGILFAKSSTKKIIHNFFRGGTILQTEPPWSQVQRTLLLVELVVSSTRWWWLDTCRLFFRREGVPVLRMNSRCSACISEFGPMKRCPVAGWASKVANFGRHGCSLPRGRIGLCLCYLTLK